MRNEIFARHGLIFKRSDLDNYFRKQPWYTPMNENVDGMLTPIEKANIELLKRIELDVRNSAG